VVGLCAAQGYLNTAAGRDTAQPQAQGQATTAHGRQLLAVPHRSPYQGPVPARNIVYFDLETQRSFNDVGGSSHKDKMGISVAVTYSTATNAYEIYNDRELDRLAEELVRADLMVG